MPGPLFRALSIEARMVVLYLRVGRSYDEILHLVRSRELEDEVVEVKDGLGFEGRADSLVPHD